MFFLLLFFLLYTDYTLTNTLGYSVRLIFVALDTVFLRSSTFTGINLGVKLFISLYLHSPKLSLYFKIKFYVVSDAFLLQGKLDRF